MFLKKISLLFLMLVALSAYSAKRYWVGNGSNLNWNYTGNWSATSGGTSGVSVPASTDTAFFDGNGLGQCSINATVSIRRFEMASGYTDTIKQNTYAITVGTSGMILSGGVFLGGSAIITNQGVFTLQGTTFQSTSGQLNLQGNFSFSSGNFLHNNGEILLTKSLTFYDNVIFYDLVISPVAGTTITIDSDKEITVEHLFKTTGSASIIVNTGKISAKGDITILNTSTTSTGGTGVIAIIGTGNQLFSGATTPNYGRLCNIQINKSSGTLSLKNYITIYRSWNYISGSIDALTDTSTVIFTGNTGDRVISGTHSLYNVIFQSISGGCTTNKIPPSDTLKIHGKIRTEGSACVVIDSGVVQILGNFEIGNNYVSAGTGGLATYLFSGNSNQTIFGTSNELEGRIANVKILKAGGVLYLKDNISVQGNWEFIQGNFDANTYSSKIVFTTNRVYGVPRNISGNFTVSSLLFDGSLNTISSGDTITVNSNLYLSGTGNLNTNNGNIKLKGDLLITNSHSNYNNSGHIILCGTGNQTIDGATTALQGKLCSVTINKPSGTTYLKNYITLTDNANWKVQSGIVDATTYASTVIFTRTAHALEGNQSFYNLILNGVNPGCTLNIPSTDTIIVNGLLTIEGTSSAAINTGLIRAKGDISITNTGTGTTSSTGTIEICGTSNQTFTGSGTILAGKICKLIVNKPSGTLNLASTITYIGDWKYLAGTVNPGSSTVVSYNAATVSGANGAAYMPFNNFRIYNNTTTLNAALIVVNDLTISNGATLNGNSKTVYVGGDWDNTGTFTYANTTVIFAGSSTVGRANQRIIKPSGTVNFYNLQIDKPNGKVYLDRTTQVNFRMSLKKGVLVSTSTNLLTIPNGFSADKVYEGSDSSYVSGPMKKTGNQAFTFPLGDTTLTSGNYHPLSITAPTNTTDAFTGEYFANFPTADTLVVDSIAICKSEYWSIARNVGTSNVLATVGWNINNCLDTTIFDMIVSGWDGTKWKSLEGTNINLQGNYGSVKSLITPVWNGTNPVNVTLGRKKSINIISQIRDPYCVTGVSTGHVIPTITYGAPPFSYSWAHGPTTKNLSGLTKGNYSLTITDRHARTFIKNYQLNDCVNWGTLPNSISIDSTGSIVKNSGDADWENGLFQSVKIIDSLENGNWIKFTVADTMSHYYIGFGSLWTDSLANETNFMLSIDGRNLTVIETDNDGFYSKYSLGQINLNDILRIELDEFGVKYFNNESLIHTGKLLSNSKLKYTANIYGQNNSIKHIRCSNN